MIAGKQYTNQQIAEEENKYLEQYYHSNDPMLADSIEYYSVLFQTFLKQNPDYNFEKMNKAAKQDIYRSEDELFRNAMQYSFNKGHQTAFLLLLMNSKSAEEYDEQFFKNPISKDIFIFNLDKLISKDVYEENLNRSRVELLIARTREYFENGYTNIMNMAKIFFKKGCLVAFSQIRNNILRIVDEHKITSRLLNVDLDNSFSVTPAFSATWALESPGFEEWDLHWDSTYGYQNNSKAIGSFLVHRFTVKEIKNYANVGAIVYQQMKDWFATNLADEEVVYLGEIKFSLIDPQNDGPRFITKTEYLAIQNALTLTLKRCLGVDAKNILVTT